MNKWLDPPTKQEVADLLLAVKDTELEPIVRKLSSDRDRLAHCCSELQLQIAQFEEILRNQPQATP